MALTAPRIKLELRRRLTPINVAIFAAMIAAGSGIGAAWSSYADRVHDEWMTRRALEVAIRHQEPILIAEVTGILDDLPDPQKLRVVQRYRIDLTNAGGTNIRASDLHPGAAITFANAIVVTVDCEKARRQTHLQCAGTADTVYLDFDLPPRQSASVAVFVIPVGHHNTDETTITAVFDATLPGGFLSVTHHDDSALRVALIGFLVGIIAGAGR